MSICGLILMAGFFAWFIGFGKTLKFWWAVTLETLSLGIGVLLIAVCLAWVFGIHETARGSGHVRLGM